MVLSGQAVRPAIRFGIAMFVGDAILIAVFGDAIPAMFGSYAVVSLLYFLDFDGSTRERLWTYLVATVVGLVAVTVGTLVAPTLWLAVLVVVPVAFGFAFSRVLKGFVARSAIGLELPFLLAVMLPANPAHLDRYLESWIVGSVIATLAALLIFPTHHTGVARRELSAWCISAADVARAVVAGSPVTADVAQLQSKMADLRLLFTANPMRPGSVSKRTRALVQMYEHAETTTSAIATLSENIFSAPAHAGVLGQLTSETLEAAARVVTGKSTDLNGQVADFAAARDADLHRAGEWTALTLKTDKDLVVDELNAHYLIRLLSISADSMYRLALRSQGVDEGLPELGVAASMTPTQLITSNLSVRSVWFRNAVRTAIAVAAAVWIARWLGLAHGIWVVMATLSVIQITFTAPASGKAALRNAGGAAIGVGLGAIIVYGHPHVWVFALILPVIAFLAKFAKVMNLYLIQLTFSIFAIVNIALLGWPPSEKLAELRVIDVVVGIVVAAAITLMVFPHGLRQLLTHSEDEAESNAHNYLVASTGLLRDREPDIAHVAELRKLSVDSLERYSDSLDSSYSAPGDTNDALRMRTEQEVSIRQTVLAGDVSAALVTPGQRPADVAGLSSALTMDQSNRALILREVVSAQSAQLIELPQALVSATWCSIWLDELEPQPPA